MINNRLYYLILNLFSAASYGKCLLLVSGFILTSCSLAEKPTSTNMEALYPSTDTVIPYHVDTTVIHYKERIQYFSENPLGYGQIVFIGDSITEMGEDWAAKFKRSDIRNRGISGDVTDGLLARLGELTHYKPKAIFLLIGINDLYNIHYQKQIPSAEYVANNILKIVQRIQTDSPDTKLFLQTILPTSEDYLIEQIKQINSVIKQAEAENNFQVIDLHTRFLGAGELIRPDLTYDGTHLTDAGYALWVETLTPILAGL